MGSLQQQALLSGSRLGHGCVCVVALLGLAGTAVAGTRTHAPLSPWDAAVRSRAAFEAEPAGAHTRDEYARVINGFRAVYHGDPGDAHAARAVEQVAELLAEEGRELADRKALQDSAGQYRFLAKAYPSYRAGKRAEGKGEGQAEAVVAASPPPHKQEVSQPRPNLSRPPSVRPASADPTTIVSTSTGPLAMVTGIRHWSTASYTRVAIDLTADDNDTVKYEAGAGAEP